MDTEETHKNTSTAQDKRPTRKKKILLYVCAAVAGVALVVAGLYGYTYTSTPEHIRKPAFEHYHFRTQIIVDGTPVDFSKGEFQNETPGSCSAEPGGTPVDFHDNMDQMTHIHWKDMTGGEFLKYFGWNFIGGSDSSMGNRFDEGMMPQSVSIFGKLLPALPQNTNFYIYTGDKDSHQQKSWDDFLYKDLEDFFGKRSNLGQANQGGFSPLAWLFPKASAHGGVVDEHEGSEKSEEELTRINNLVGNVVIFAQEDKPIEEQVQARFNNLVPLHDSTCGG